MSRFFVPFFIGGDRVRIIGYYQGFDCTYLTRNLFCAIESEHLTRASESAKDEKNKIITHRPKKSDSMVTRKMKTILTPFHWISPVTCSPKYPRRLVYPLPSRYMYHRRIENNDHLICFVRVINLGRFSLFERQSRYVCVSIGMCFDVFQRVGNRSRKVISKQVFIEEWKRSLERCASVTFRAFLHHRCFGAKNLFEGSSSLDRREKTVQHLLASWPRSSSRWRVCCT